MRKTSILIGICMVAAMVITLVAQGRDIAPVMKETQPTFLALSKDIKAGSAADAVGPSTLTLRASRLTLYGITCLPLE